jgi:hypothetical protein
MHAQWHYGGMNAKSWTSQTSLEVHDDDVDETPEDGTYSPWMAQGIQFDLDNRNPQGSIFIQIKTRLAYIDKNKIG